MKLRLALGSIAVAGLVLVAGCLGGTLWLVFGNGPLVTYGASPARVDDAGLSETGYVEVSTARVPVDQSLAPLIGLDRDVRLWTDVAVYASGPGFADGTAGNATNRTPGNTTVDVRDTAMAVAFSMSAMKLGPLEANPVVHATSPRLVGASGFAVDYVEGFLPGNVTGLTLETSERVELLGKRTRVSTFAGRVSEGNGTGTNVTVRLARVTHEGDLVILLSVSPRSADGPDAQFRTLLSHVVHGSRN